METLSSLPDDVKIATMMIETKGSLQEHHRLNAMDLKSYSDVKHMPRIRRRWNSTDGD